MNRIINGRTTAAVIGAACLSISGAADVTQSYYNGPDHWNFQRIGIPDLDQERLGLQNDGACYCVPTSTMNLLMYAANHGFPGIDPGPGIWNSPGTYFQATNEINLLGGFLFMDICYGFGEAGEEGDCIETDCDGNGDCEESCGSTSASAANAGLIDWLDPENLDELTVNYWKADGTSTPRLKDLFALSFLEGAPLMRVNYGRYEVIDIDDGSPIYRRSGGHAMSFAGCRSNGAYKELAVRNPGTDENTTDLGAQSTFVTDYYYGVVDIVVRVTKEQEAPVDDYDLRIHTYLGSTSANELQLLDTVAWIAPKKGHTWTSGWIYGIPIGDQGFGTELSGPSGIPLSSGTIDDVVLDSVGLGYVAIVTEPAGAAEIRYVNRVIGEEHHIADVSGAVALATGREHDLYVVSNVTGGGSTTRRFAPAPESGLGDYAESSDTLSLPFDLHGCVFDDATDQLVMLSTSFMKLVRAPRDLGAGGPGGDPVQMWDIPTVVPMNGAASIAVEPGTGTTWLATGASDSLYGLTVGGAGGLQIETLSHPDVVDPTGVSFDDSGRMYVRGALGAIVLERIVGGWDRDKAAEVPFEGVELGEKILMDRSRSNFDPGSADLDAWTNIHPDELEHLSVPIPDCPADVDGNGVVDVSDLVAVILAWGPCGGCAEDIDVNGFVDVGDLVAVILAWGACS